ARKITIGLPFNQIDQCHSLIGHRSSPSLVSSCATRTFAEDRRGPPASPPAARYATPRAPHAACYTKRWDTAAKFSLKFHSVPKAPQRRTPTTPACTDPVIILIATPAPFANKAFHEVDLPHIVKRKLYSQ
ncbi:MAG: hypothetical protein Q4P24_15745, partial [Rhodobacterales bacterium]|nr:hypothetical protein [Rhodobacterales bacterium]